MARLDLDQCLSGDLLEIVLADEDFSRIQETGFFEDINRNLDTLIDDFEDEAITERAHMELILKLSKEYGEKFKVDFFGDLIPIVEEAMRKKTGIFFYF
jgi:hypothetical protein